MKKNNFEMENFSDNNKFTNGTYSSGHTSGYIQNDTSSQQSNEHQRILSSTAGKDGDQNMFDVSTDPPRETWSKKMDYLLSIIGYAVDLANVWRFPYLCYKNGGGAFLVPYFSLLLVGALPVFFMEVSLGQYHSKGPSAVWKIAPMFKGIGIASCYMAYIVAFYYNIVIGWGFYYFFSSFASPLPWTTCNNEWNTENCWQTDWEISNETKTNISIYNRTYDANTTVSSTTEFFERGMLQMHHSTGIDDLGAVQWSLVGCTLLTFVILYFSLWKGVKSSGKVVWVTATLPYVILSILLVRGAMLPGAAKGIAYFITPNLNSLGELQVWIDAAVQIFFSVGAGFGTHIAYASYNKFNNNCQRDILITAVVNCFTSIFSGFVIFSYLGYMANQTNKNIADVASEGPGLVFIVYPEAIATLPGSAGWAVIFFLMLLSLGIDSAFGGLEAPLTGVKDELKDFVKEHKYGREIITLVIVGSAFLFAIPCTTEGGMFIFKMLDTFAAGTSIVFIVLCQVVVVSWVYGLDTLSNDIEEMIGTRPFIYWKICWKFVCPIVLLVIVISSVVTYSPLEYISTDRTYVYPFYANVIGWLIALSSISIVPGFAIYKILVTPGTLTERLALGISPEWEHEKIRRTGEVKRFHRQHWTYL